MAFINSYFGISKPAFFIYATRPIFSARIGTELRSNIVETVIGKLAQDEQAINIENFVLPDSAQFARAACAENTVLRQEYRIRHTDSVNGIKINKDGKYIVTASKDGTAKAYSVDRKQNVATVEHGDNVYQAQFSPSGFHVVTSAANKTLKITNIARGKSVSQDIAAPHAFPAMHFVPGHALMLLGSPVDDLMMYDFSQKDFLRVAGPNTMHRVAYSPDGNHLARSIDGNDIILTDLSTNMLATIPKNGETVLLTWSPDAQSLLILNKDGQVRIYNMQAKALASTVLQHDAPMELLHYSLDGKFLALVTDEVAQRVRVYDLKSLQQVALINQHAGIVKSIQFSPNGSYIAVAGEGDKAVVYDLQHKKLLTTIEHQDTVEYVVFSPDNRYLFTLSKDKTGVLYDLAHAKQVVRIQHNNNFEHDPYDKQSIKLALFTPDSRYLAMVDGNDARVIPLSLCELPAQQSIILIVLARLAENIRNKTVQLEYIQHSSWIFKGFMKLPKETQNYFYQHYPEIKAIMGMPSF